jgi:hypothetical protein
VPKCRADGLCDMKTNREEEETGIIKSGLNKATMQSVSRRVEEMREGDLPPMASAGTDWSAGRRQGFSELLRKRVQLLPLQTLQTQKPEAPRPLFNPIPAAQLLSRR